MSRFLPCFCRWGGMRWRMQCLPGSPLAFEFLQDWSFFCGGLTVVWQLSTVVRMLKPTNPNADTYVEEQKQYLFRTFSSKPTCGTPWRDTLRWHSCRTPFLLDTLVRHSYLPLFSDALTWHFLLDILVRHSYLTLFWDTLTCHFCKTPLTWHSCKTLVLDTSCSTLL